MPKQEHSLKVDLVRYLEEIRTLGSLLDFWYLVESAESLLNPPKVLLEKDADEDDTLDLDTIFKQLKEIVSPKKVALMILEMVNVKEDALDLTKEFVSVVSEIDEVEQENGKDYLERLTGITKTLIASMTTLVYPFNYFDFFEYSEKCFAALDTYFFLHRNNETEKMLLVIFEIGMKELKFSEEEKNEIGSLLVDAIDPIEYCVFHISVEVTQKLESKYLKIRSALKFFTEVYAKFPSGDKTVQEVVNMAAIRNSIDTSETIISDLWDIYSASDSDNSDFEDASEVPGSHIWWPKNGAKGFVC